MSALSGMVGTNLILSLLTTCNVASESKTEALVLLKSNMGLVATALDCIIPDSLLPAAVSSGFLYSVPLFVTFVVPAVTCGMSAVFACELTSFLFVIVACSMELILNSFF